MEKNSRVLTSGGRALSPTRESILRVIDRAETPQTLADIADRLDLHENTVRMHLAALHRDGFVHRSRAKGAERGRPAWQWQRQRRESSPYVALVAALVEQLRSDSPNPTASARQAGRAWGHALATHHEHSPDTSETTPSAHARDARDVVTEILRAEGFAPHPEGNATMLRQCPLIEAANANPDIVCAVHLGMVQGVLEHQGHPHSEVSLTPMTAPGTCTLRMHISEPT